MKPWRSALHVVSEFTRVPRGDRKVSLPPCCSLFPAAGFNNGLHAWLSHQSAARLFSSAPACFPPTGEQRAENSAEPHEGLLHVLGDFTTRKGVKIHNLCQVSSSYFCHVTQLTETTDTSVSFPLQASTRLNPTPIELTWLNPTQLNSTWLNPTPLPSTQPGTTQPDSNRTDLTQPNSTRLNLTQLPSTQPGSAQFDSYWPDSTQPDSSRLDPTPRLLTWPLLDQLNLTPLAPFRFLQCQNCHLCDTERSRRQRSDVGLHKLSMSSNLPVFVSLEDEVSLAQLMWIILVLYPAQTLI